MTEGPGIATMAYLGEQVPDFGNAFGPPPLQQNAEICRGGRRRRHCVAVRQIDATDPPFNPSAAETEFAGDFADGTAPIKKGPYLVKDLLSDSLAFVAYQARLSDRVRRTIRPFGKRRRRMIVAGIDPSISDRRFIAAKLALDDLAEVLQQMKAIGDLPRLRRALTHRLRIEASTIAADHLHVRVILTWGASGSRVKIICA